MELSDEGAAFIAKEEGKVNTLYEDQLGHTTIGIGHLVHLGPIDGSEPEAFQKGLTDAEVFDLFRTDADVYVAAVNRFVTVPLSQRQFDALVSFAFNWGIGAGKGFPATSVLAYVNLGDFAKAADDLIDGHGPSGRRYDKGLAGVRNRRIAEADWLRQGLATGDSTMQLVTRDEWGARAPKATTPIGSALIGVACHWEGPHMDWPWDHSQCAPKVQGIQAYHMDNQNWNDVAYNALVCGHGYVFEGRGPGLRSGANGDATVNGTHYAICYLAGEDDAFTGEARDAFNDAADWLDIANGEWVGHRDLTQTACPGDEIYAWVHSGHPRTHAATPTQEDDLAGSEEMLGHLNDQLTFVNQRLQLMVEADHANKADSTLEQILTELQTLNANLAKKG